MKKILYIFILALVLTGCGKAEEQVESKWEEIKQSCDGQIADEEIDADLSEEKDEDSQSATETQNDDEVQEPSNQAESNTGSNNDTTKKPSNGTNNTGSTTKPSTGSTGSTGSAGSTGNTQNNNSGTTTQPSQPAHTHSWTEVRETVVVKGAWVEDIYAWRTICGKCGLDMTEMTAEDVAIHCSIRCNSRYSAKYIKIDEIQHPAVTEERVTGYKCSCGATK